MNQLFRDYARAVRALNGATGDITKLARKVARAEKALRNAGAPADVIAFVARRPDALVRAPKVYRPEKYQGDNWKALVNAAFDAWEGK